MGRDGVGAGVLCLALRTVHFLGWYAFGKVYRKWFDGAFKRLAIRYGVFAYVMVFLAIDAATKGVCSVTVSWLNFYAGAVSVLVMLDGVFGLMLLGRLLEPMARGSRTIALLSQNTFAIMCHHLLGMFVATRAIALASKFTPWFNSLDMQSYLWRFDYAWFPNGLAEFTWAYVVFGIAFAIWFQRVIDGGVAVICRMLRCMFRCNES